MSRAINKDSILFLQDRFLYDGGKEMGSYFYRITNWNLWEYVDLFSSERRIHVYIEPLFVQIIFWKRKILNAIFYLGTHRFKILLSFINTPHKNRPDTFYTITRQMRWIPKLKSKAAPTSALEEQRWQRFNGEGRAGWDVEKKRQVVDGPEDKGRKRNKISKDQHTSILVAAESHNQDQIRQLLTSAYKVVSAYDGREAYEAVVKEHPQVVIVDASLPLMNGYDLLSLIKSNRALEDTSVILLVSHMVDEPQQEDILEEADEFLIKPFTRHELLTRVRTQVELRENRKIIREQEVQLSRRSIEQKDRFIGIAGHELKTPLTSLQAYTELLVEKASTLDRETLQKYLNKSKTFVKRLNRLVTDLLDVSRMTNGKMEYRFRDFNFREMVEENVEMIRSFASAHTFRVGGDLPVVLHGDRERLEQVVQNLLSNAVRYSPNGGTISVYCKRVNNNIIVSVRDEGLGIPDAEKRKIFESYNRASMKHQISGLGLGLFICATIIERHGGRIWLESKVDKGSVFYFSLPQ